MPGPAFIEGESVELRTIEEEDIAFMQTVVNDREIWRAIGRPSPVNRAQEREFFDEIVSDDEQLTLMIAAEDQPVGMVSLTPGSENDSAELGYWVAPEHQREGYGSAGVTHTLSYGFDQQGYHRIAARVFAFNKASQALLESLGFQQEGRHREATFIDGEYEDVLWYGLLAEEWDHDESGRA